MFSRSTERFSIVDGLRGLSVLWMVSFHSLFYFGEFVNAADYQQFLARFQPTFFANGHFGVDIFFVISGFLIADILLREWERNGRINYLSFYMRRAFRILPLYFVVLFLCIVTGVHTVAQILPNLFFVNNFVTYSQQAVNWTWSLAIEEQFYVLFPLLLAFLAARTRDVRKIVLVYSGLIVLTMVITAILLVWARIFTSPASHPVLGASFLTYFDTVYDKTYCRIGEIILGIIVAYFKPHRSPKPWSARRVLAQRVIMYMAVALVVAIAFWPAEDGPDPSPAIVVAFFATYRTIFAAAVAIVLFCGLRTEFKRDPVVRFLSWPIWILFAELSYGAYLAHPLVINAAYKYIFPPEWIAQHHVLLPLLFIEVITFVIALATYRIIERPMREWGRSLAKSAGA